MNDDSQDFQQRLISAVQSELERHGRVLNEELKAIREESAADVQALRSEITSLVEQVAAVSDRVDNDADRIDKVRTQLEEQVAVASERFDADGDRIDKVRTQLEERVAEVEQRQARRVDDLADGLESMVSIAAKPLLDSVTDGQELLGERVDVLDANLRKFDEQAARMVTYVNEVTDGIDAKNDTAREELTADIEARIASIRQHVDDNDAAVRKFQNEVGQTVSNRIGDAEGRLNQRMLAAESRIKEDAGQKIADIDVHVSKVAGGLEETLTVMNERLATLDDRFVEQSRKIAAMEQSLEGIDEDAIEELKEKMSSAIGEATLVRIEMERLEKAVNQRSDKLATRVTEVETQLADQTLDVSTAVQLERLEEIERQLLELDPDQFVKVGGTSTQPTPPPAGIRALTDNEPSEPSQPAHDSLAAVAAMVHGTGQNNG